jgi:hypothetical protein
MKSVEDRSFSVDDDDKIKKSQPCNRPWRPIGL